MIRDQIHADVCRNGFNSELDSFAQTYGSKVLDASLLLLPIVGFLPPSDPRISARFARSNVVSSSTVLSSATTPGKPTMDYRPEKARSSLAASGSSTI